MQTQVVPAILILADISGYTRFMLSHEKALEHSQMIVGGLIESLMEQVDRPLRIVELEGDAVFMYSRKTEDEEAWRIRRRHLLDRILHLFHTFDRRLAELAAYSVCHCDACATLGDLTLKVICHSGEALVGRVGEFDVLSGPDVIKVHRLLKNSVEADRYVLMTDAAHADLPVPEGVTVTASRESYDIGTIDTHFYVPEIREPGEDDLRRSFSDDNVAVKILRHEVRREYEAVADDPARGYHFNTGQAAARMAEYDPSWVDRVPEEVVASFAGTGNPFALGELSRGEHVVDVGSGAGMDAMIAGLMVGEAGHVIGVDMTPVMVEKARRAAAARGMRQVEFREGFAESLPVPDQWADVVISNGSVNLSPNKSRVFGEMFRVLRPGGRIQIGDITVEREVPEEAKHDIDLWTN